jgi:hypothetical protein
MVDKVYHANDPMQVKKCIEIKGNGLKNKVGSKHFLQQINFGPEGFGLCDVHDMIQFILPCEQQLLIELAINSGDFW